MSYHKTQKYSSMKLEKNTKRNEKFNKEIEILKKKKRTKQILELKNSVTYVKKQNRENENNRTDQAEDAIIQLENRNTKLTQ